MMVDAWGLLGGSLEVLRGAWVSIWRAFGPLGGHLAGLGVVLGSNLGNCWKVYVFLKLVLIISSWVPLGETIKTMHVFSSCLVE